MSLFARATPIVVVDCHSVLHSNRYILKKRPDPVTKYGLIQSFFKSMETIAENLYVHKFIFMWDSPINNRKLAYSWYKAGRDVNRAEEDIKFDEDCFMQFHLLRDKLLPYIGYRCYIHEGFEADDLIASVVKNNKGPFIIVSADADLYQLLPYATIYDYHHKRIYNNSQFAEEYGIPAEDWWKVKAIAGCKSDNVGGVKGVGEMTAIKYLRGELKAGKKYDDIQKSTDIIERNKKLVELPYEGCPDITVGGIRTPSLDMFKDVAMYYDLWMYHNENAINKLATLMHME